MELPSAPSGSSLIWIKYNHNTHALVGLNETPKQGRMYALLREINKRNETKAWEVKAYGNFAGCFEEERTYDYDKQFALDAAYAIANKIDKSLSKDPAKEIVLANAKADENYRPYCLRCKGLVRMKKVESLYWTCPCGAVADYRKEGK